MRGPDQARSGTNPREKKIILRDQSHSSILCTLGSLPEPHFSDAGIVPRPWLGLLIFTWCSGDLHLRIVTEFNFVLFSGISWHPGGKYLLSASDDKTLRVWDLVHRRCHKRLDAHNHFTTSIGWYYCSFSQAHDWSVSTTPRHDHWSSIKQLIQK